MTHILSINPATGETIGKTTASTPAQVRDAVQNARAAFNIWRTVPIADRAEYFRKLVSLIERNTQELAELMTAEMGKPIHEAREEIVAELAFIRWYADHAVDALGEHVVKEDETAVYKTVYEPWGVCASISPWNFPISMASTGIIAQLIAGNTVVFKPSEYTTLTQLRFVDLCNQTGLPHGVLQSVTGAGDVGAALVDGDIDLVWFTGSTNVGMEIYKKCADKFIKPLLELGGSSPAIVFADCDFEKTVETVFSARFFNCGQVCSAVKRAYIESSIFDKFVSALVDRAQAVTVGNPAGDAQMGPIVSKKQLDLILNQIADAKGKGARFETGGDRLTGAGYEKGNFISPAIVTGVTPDMRIVSEEVFGPVLPVIPFSGEEEAIRLANDTPYGLTAEVFTKDPVKARRVASQIRAGGISVNMDISYNPDSPIGGFKKSGLGREYGIEGFRELAQLKYICSAK